MILYFLTLEFSPYFCKHWHCDLTLSNIGIQALFLWTLQLWPYPFFHWNSFFNIGILTLSFLALEFCLCFIKHWNSPPSSLLNTGTLILSFLTLEFCPFYLNSGILISSFPTLEICPNFFERWNYDLILPYILILPLFY